MRNRDKPIGAGLGMAAVAAARDHLLYGTWRDRNREKISGWSLRMKGEVLEELENRKEIDREAYHWLVDKTAQRYARNKRASDSELKRMAAELKDAWEHISKELI